MASGAIEGPKEVEMLFSQISLVSIPSTFIVIFASGYFSDIIKPVYMIAPAFFCRSIVTYCFKLIDEPTSWLTFALSAAMIACSVVQVVSLESLFMKNLPGDVRGAMTILLAFFLSLAALLYNGVGGPVFDSLGPASPFVLVSAFDFAFCLFAIMLGCSGYLDFPYDIE